MTQIYAFPGAQNVYVPTPGDAEAARGALIVDYGRNVADFDINKYCQIIPTKRQQGLYMKMTVEQAGRVVNTNLADFEWPDGDVRPEGRSELESFTFLPYTTKRRDYPYTMGYLTSEQADWNILAQHSRIHAQRAMTARTVFAVAKLQNVNNWSSSHKADVASISGNSGRWDQSTTARSDIKRSLNYAAEQILLDTLGAVKLSDLMLVMGPGTARRICESQEIINAIIQSPDALAQVRGELPGRNVMFGLPDQLFGFPVIVDPTVRVSTRKLASSTTKAFVWDMSIPIMMARPGGLVGLEGSPNFATAGFFMKEEMTVETFDEPQNRRIVCGIVEDWDFQIISDVSGFAFTTAVA